MAPVHGYPAPEGHGDGYGQHDAFGGARPPPPPPAQPYGVDPYMQHADPYRQDPNRQPAMPGPPPGAPYGAPPPPPGMNVIKNSFSGG